MSAFINAPLEAPRAHIGSMVDAASNSIWRFARASGDAWETKVEEYILKHSLSPSVLGWAQRVLETAVVFRGLRRREQLVLVLRYAYMKQIRGIDPVQERVIFQYDQGVDRCPTCVLYAPCICPKGKYWDSFCMRPLEAQEHAALQGIGERERAFFGLGDIDDRLLKDLVGNVFSGNVCMVMLFGALAAWKR